MINMLLKWVAFALIINIFVKPLLVLITLPINLITLGLFSFIINALLLMLTAYLTPGFEINNFWSALLGSLLLSILSALLNRD